jgi:hypothetical protein
VTARPWLTLWLLRKAVRMFAWLALFALAAAIWPVTLVAITGYGTAWLRGWPPVRLRRAASWSLPMTVVWLVGVAVHGGGWQANALAPVRDWQRVFSGAGAAREFLLLSPVAVPAGLLLAAGLWAWRIYAISTGIGGRMASAPISFDARQWRRQVRTAKARTAAPGAGPGRADPGRRDNPGDRAPLAAGVHRAVHGVRAAHGDRRLDGIREDEPDDPAVGRMVQRRARRLSQRRAAAAARGA